MDVFVSLILLHIFAYGGTWLFAPDGVNVAFKWELSIAGLVALGWILIAIIVGLVT